MRLINRISGQKHHYLADYKIAKYVISRGFPELAYLVIDTAVDISEKEYLKKINKLKIELKDCEPCKKYIFTRKVSKRLFKKGSSEESSEGEDNYSDDSSDDE